MDDNTPKEDSQQEEIKNTKISDEDTKSDRPHSDVELIPITDSEQTINNIMEEERARADTDEAKVVTEETAEPVTEEKSNSKLEEQKEGIEEVLHTSVRRIEKIFDTETEKEIVAEEFFARPESEIIKWREEFERCIKFNEKRFLCPFCRQQIKIAGRKFDRGHVSFFAHLHDSADCPIKTSVNMSKEEIEARKYGLCQESERHKELKQGIYDGLNGEQSKQQGVDNIMIEKRINANIPYLNWRRPDICATFKALNVVFELQLSTTFLSTIVDRDIFYRLHHYFIIWVFNFEKNVKYVDLNNLMMKDIYYTNKRNIFVFDSEAREESEKRKELVLKCNWLTSENQWKYPITNRDKDGLDMSGKLITLSDLTFDETSGKVYYVDAEEEYYNAHPGAREIEKRIENDRKQLLERWMAHVKRNNDVPDEQEMMGLVSQMIAKAERAVIYKVDNKMGLMYNSRHLTAPLYSSIEAQGDYFLAKYNRKTALYDQYGRQILPCEYLNIYQRENGLIFAESTSTWSLVFDDKIEKLCDRKPHDQITIQDEGIRLRITIEHPYNGSETGYVLTDGINIIPFIYQSTKNCRDGEHIIVCRNNLYGIYSKDLRLIIPIAYQRCTAIDNNYFIVQIIRDNAVENYGLYDCRGKQILPSQFNRIYHIDDDLFILKKDDGKFILYNAACSRYIFGEEGFDDIKTYNNHTLFQLLKDYKYALANLDGAILTPFKYDYMDFSHKDYIKVKVGESIGTLNYNGKEIYDNEATLRDGYVATSFFSKWNVMHNEKECLPRIYDAIELLTNDWVKVSQTDLWGICDLNGKCLLPIAYASITLYEEQGYIVVSQRKEGYSLQKIYGILNMNLETVLPIACTEPIKPLSKEYALVGSSTFGILSIYSNKTIIPTSYSDITVLTDKLFVVTTKLKTTYWNSPKNFLKYGLYDKSGKRLFLCEYDEIKLVTDNLVKLCKGFQYLIFRTSDQQTLKQTYSFIGQPDKEGNIKVQGNNTEGYINGVGEPIYTDTETFDDGSIKICFLGKYGLKSSDGTLVFDCGFNDIRYLKKGVYAIKTGNEWGVKNQKGKLLLACMYTSIEGVSDILLKVQSKGYYGHDGTYSIYNMATCQLHKETYDTVGYTDEKGQILVTYCGKTFYIGADGTPIYYVNETINNAYAIVNRLDQYGVNSINGSILIPCMYRHVTPIKNDLFAVQNTDHKWGIISINGDVLLPNEYDSISILSDVLLKVEKYSNYYRHAYILFNLSTRHLLDEMAYDHISEMDENGEITVELANRKGKIDENGNKIYEKNAVEDGYVIYSFLGQSGIESDGTAITACKYESITYLGNHYFILTSNNLHGLFLSNEQILPINYQTIIKLTNNLLKIKDSSGCQLYDLTQRKVITPYYQNIQAPDKNTGMLTVYTKADKIGYINQQGEVQYTKKAIGEAYYIIEAFGEFGLADTKNKQLCPCHYKQINHLYGHLFAVLSMKKKKWGLYSAKESKVLTEFIYDEIWVDKNNSTLLAKRDNKTGRLSEKGKEVHNILSFNLGENVSVIQCFDRVGIQNKETDEWLLPMKYQQFKKAGIFLLFREGYQWGLMDMTFHVLIEAKYKIMKIWNSDIFIVAETQYKSYGYDRYPKTRYGIISASGINLLACNYVKIHIVNSKLVAAIRTMNEQALYFTVNNGTLQTVKREDLTQYINKCTFKVNEEYEGVIINKNPYSGIFVEVKKEGIGCIPKAALPKDYMQNKNMKKGMPIKVEVTNINEVNQVKFKLVSVR